MADTFKFRGRINRSWPEMNWSWSMSMKKTTRSPHDAATHFWPEQLSYKCLRLVILSEISQTEKEKQTQRLHLWLSSVEDWREGIVRESVMESYTLLYLKWITNKDPQYSTGTLLNAMWQPECEGSLGENGYMYMYGWAPLLSTWVCHNAGNRLYPNTK